MRPVYRVALCSAMMFAITCLCAAQTAPAPTSVSDPVHVEINGANGEQFTQAYRDANGKPIDAATFNEAIKSGRDFTPTLDPGKKVLTLTLKSSMATAASSDLAIHAGQTLPHFHLPTLDRIKVSPVELDGKPTLVDFFFADCVGCIEELPALDAYAAKHPDMHFLAVTFDDAVTAQNFVRQRHFRWPVAYDGKPLLDQLGVREFPTMLLLDTHGQLLAIRTGSLPYSAKESVNSSTAQPDEAERKQSQLQWLDHWVTNTLAHSDSDKK